MKEVHAVTDTNEETMEEEAPMMKKHIEVSGKLLHIRKSVAFFSFHWNGSQEEQICYFFPNKVIVEQQKLAPMNLLISGLEVGDSVGGYVVPNSTPDPWKTNDLKDNTSKITPGWYALAVWKGKKPPKVWAVLKPKEIKQPMDEKVCPNCKVLKSKCLNGQEVYSTNLQSDQVST